MHTRKRILVVDDDEVMCRLFPKWLAPHRAQTARTGEAALMQIRNNALYDTILLDLHWWDVRAYVSR
jgi:CheY-like chemotaxis protein